MAVHSARAERISSLYELKAGDHIKVKKLPIYHHMIVVRVVSETTIRVIHSSKKAGVEEKDVQYRPEKITLLVYECPYSRQQIIKRARKHIGESYSLFWSNCEHFATEVRTGEKQSLQVQNGVAVGTGVAVGAAIGVGLLAAGLWYLSQKDKKIDSDSDSESDSESDSHSYSKRGTCYQYS